MPWPGGHHMVYGMAWQASYGLWYGLAGNAWHSMAWQAMHGILYGIICPCGHGMGYGHHMV